LSRTPKLDAAIVEELTTLAGSLGFKTGELIFVSQEQD
jgi:lipocalin